MSSGVFSCAERCLTCWNYFPIGFKSQTLIVLLQHKLAAMKRVGEATVRGTNKYRQAAELANKSNISDRRWVCQAFAR